MHAQFNASAVRVQAVNTRACLEEKEESAKTEHGTWPLI
jgi:hypothetical protein